MCIIYRAFFRVKAQSATPLSTTGNSQGGGPGGVAGSGVGGAL